MLRLVLVSLFCCCVGAGQAFAQDDRSAGIKSVYLVNFTQFVDWPPGVFETSSAPFVIAIVGADPMAAHLDRLVRDLKVKGHPVVLRRCASVREAGPAHLLFISGIVTERLTPAQPTLLVGEASDFLDNGGMIQFYQDGARVHFRIRPAAARAAHLNISSRLLRLAKIVE